MSIALISSRDARALAGGISRRTEDRRIKDDPDWPRPVPPEGPGHPRYYMASEIEEYIRRQVARRDARPAPGRQAAA
jgi:hypothetical protein